MTEAKRWQDYKVPVAVSVGVTSLVWLFLFTLVMMDPARHHVNLFFGGQPVADGKANGIDYVPDDPVTIPFDFKRFGNKTGTPDLKIDQPPCVKTAAEEEPEQVHIALAGPDGMFVSWVTGSPSMVDTTLPEHVARSTADSVVLYGTESGQYTAQAEGETSGYEQVYPEETYISGTFHHVKLSGLEPSTTYYLTCGDPDVAMSGEFSFTTPQPIGPEAFPQAIGVIGDLGQTHNSSTTLQHVLASDPPVVLLVGDMAYADNYWPNGTVRPPATNLTTYWHPTYPPRWDSWHRFVQPLASKTPMMVIEGNHEIERDAANRTFQAYFNRFRVPHAESGSPSPHFYSFDLAGAHFLMLGAYTGFNQSSAQYKWLKADLAAFNRTRTPWLIATFHATWYNTYEAHYKEAECMRQAMEPLLYEYGVDIMFAGHVHAYERCNRVYNYTVDPCGPVSVTVGDGGNIEQLYTSWVDRGGVCPEPNPEWCPSYQSKDEGEFCPSSQPDWSAFRYPSFGHGILELLSPTEARWTWHANQDNVAVASDQLNITRSLACPNQQR